MTEQELIAPELPDQRDPRVSDLVSGWYKIAQSDQICTKEALQVDNFPTQIVVWRGEDLSLIHISEPTRRS